jgi:F5/8 type C domain/Right handed beta helix region
MSVLRSQVVTLAVATSLRSRSRFAAVTAATTLTIAAVLSGAPAIAAAPAPQVATAVYVSPTGSDSATGDSTHPFLTLQHARDYVRTIDTNMTNDINVILESGTYPLTQPLALTSADSGTNGHTITWKADTGATPVVSGGTTVTGWSTVSGSPSIYVAHVGAIDTRQLYVNGVRQTRARSADNPSGFTKTSTGYTTTSSVYSTYTNQSNIEITSRWGWKLYRCPVQSIVGTTITMQQPCWNNANLQSGQEIQNPSWIENAYQLLDSPGEWYLDKSAGNLYYMPAAGVNMSTAQITVPVVEGLVNAIGTLASPISNVAFTGITFSYSSWLAPNSSDGMAEGQAGFRMVGTNSTFDSTRLNWQKTPGAVNIGYSRNVSFTGDTFTHLGAVGLNLNTGSQGTNIIGNVFTDISATGIQIGGTDVVDHHPTDPGQITLNTMVKDNVVDNVAVEYTGSVGILATYTSGTTITHNKVFNLPYSGISVGWGWGLTDQGGDTNVPGNSGVPVYTTPTPSQNYVVSDNDIGSIMKLQSDGGAIYTLSSNPNSTISGNYIHDIPTQAYGAIYDDEGSRYFHTTDNALCNVTYQWLLMNHGLNITADRNFTTQPAYTTQANTLNTTIANNTTLSSCSQLPASIVDTAGLEPAYQYLSPNTPSTDTTAPTAPNVTSVSATFPTVADLTWTAATDAVGVTGYSIYQNGTLVSASSGTSARVTGLAPGSTSTWTVKARDAAGNESAAGTAMNLTTPPGPDLAIGKTVTASSYSTPNTVGLAVDGDPTTRWAQGLGLADPSWLEVDLGARYDLTGIITTFEKSSGYKYKMETSLDGSTWTTFEDHTGSNTTAATNYSVPARPTGARYVRITITGSSGNGGSLYELEVYGNMDLALGKTATASSYSSPNTVGLAVDGDPTTRWAQGLGLPDPSWLEVDLGARYDLNEVVTSFEKTSGYKYKVETSLDGSTWTTLEDHTGTATTASTNYSIAAHPSGARYVRVTVTGSSGNGGSIYELQVYGRTDLALGAAVSVSSFSTPNVAALATDGNLTTRWAQGLTLPDPSWITVDLGSTMSIASVIATFELTSGYKYRIEYSTDNSTWSLFDDRTASSTTQSANTSTVTTPVSARYVRLTVVNSSGNGGSLYEIQVHPAT